MVLTSPTIIYLHTGHGRLHAHLQLRLSHRELPCETVPQHGPLNLSRSSAPYTDTAVAPGSCTAREAVGHHGEPQNNSPHHQRTDRGLTGMVSGTPEKELATYTSSLTPVTRGPSTHTHTQHTHTQTSTRH